MTPTSLANSRVIGCNRFEPCRFGVLKGQMPQPADADHGHNLTRLLPLGTPALCPPGPVFSPRSPWSAAVYRRFDFTCPAFSPKRRGAPPEANQYPWCSAAWFERSATPAQVKTVYSFKTDRIRVIDDF
jgi:hypothetical protein